jgi:hypothetical protein
MRGGKMYVPIQEIYFLTYRNAEKINQSKSKEILKNCLLIGNRGYISEKLRVDLFNYSNIKLSVPIRKNQHEFVPFSKIISTVRKRIERAISQLSGQFLLHINLAKTCQGLATRITSKLTSFTRVKYLNFFIFKRSLNKIKINLC